VIHHTPRRRHFSSPPKARGGGWLTVSVLYWPLHPQAEMLGDRAVMAVELGLLLINVDLTVDFNNRLWMAREQLDVLGVWRHRFIGPQQGVPTGEWGRLMWGGPHIMEG
jgi:hypothetical protein